MAKNERGLPDKFSLKVSADTVAAPIDLGDYLDERDDDRSARPASHPRPSRRPTDHQHGSARTDWPDLDEVGEERDANDEPSASMPIRRVQPVRSGFAGGGMSVGTARRPVKPRRKQINMRPETQKMADALLDHVQTYSLQADTKGSELFDALISLAYEARDHLDLSRVPPRGRWGSPTARAFTTAIKRAFEQAVVERFHAKSRG